MTTRGAAPSAAAGDEAARPRTAGGRLVVLLTSLAVVLLAGAWLALGTHPRIEVTGASWADPRLVEWPSPQDVADDVSDSGASWVLWDSDGAVEASVEVRNRQPYPVTVAAGEPAPGVVVLLARGAGPGRLAPEDLALSDGVVVVGPGESFAVAVLLTAECIQLSAGNAAGTDRAPIDVAGLGLHATVEVPLPATYLVGRTADHVPGAGCP